MQINELVNLILYTCSYLMQLLGQNRSQLALRILHNTFRKTFFNIFKETKFRIYCNRNYSKIKYNQ